MDDEARLIARAIELAREVVDLPTGYEPLDLRSHTYVDRSSGGSVEIYKTWNWDIDDTHDVSVAFTVGDDVFTVQVGTLRPGEIQGTFFRWDVGVADLKVRESRPGTSILNHVYPRDEGTQRSSGVGEA